MVSSSVEVSVVIPTYCEAKNLSILVPRLAAILCKARLHAEIIVVDDHSDDGTDELCAELSRSLPLRLVSRHGQRGLASAVAVGLKQARGQILVVMDADLSHPPESVPQLVSACRSQTVDFVIGSRYVKGSAVDAAWPHFRRLNSWVASLLARGLTSARDPLAGFFAVRKSTLGTADRLEPIGYKIGLEIIVRCDCRRIVEIPIAFGDRVHGQSKMTFNQQWQYIRHLGHLYDAKYPRTTRLFRFGLIGFSGMILDLTLFSIILLWAPLLFSRVTAIACATIWNFVGNRQVTFRPAGKRSIARQFCSYIAASQIGAAINCSVTLTLFATSEVFKTIPILAAAIGAAAGAATNFVLCQRLVFRDSKMEHPRISLAREKLAEPRAA